MTERQASPAFNVLINSRDLHLLDACNIR